MALNILSILAILANPKRLFSSAKLVLINLRNRLKIGILKAFECLKLYIKKKKHANNFSLKRTCHWHLLSAISSRLAVN
jgi:hypothetical protein